MKALLWFVAVSLVVSISHCSKKPVGIARKEDIPYIKCQVCEKLGKELHQQVQKKQAEISPKKISEYQIIEITENSCNLKKSEADWILRIDIVEKGDRLELVEQDSEGQCNSECKTIERACQEVLGYSDTDVAEYLYKSKPNVDSLRNYLCKDLTKTCSTNPPPVPKDRTPGEPFVAKSDKEAEMEKILKSMEVGLEPFVFICVIKKMKALLWFVAVSLVVSISHCSKKPVGIARKEDIPYIKCQVCEKLGKELHQQVQKKQAEISPKKISEYQIIEITENSCNLKKSEADWILRIDIVEKGDRLELVEQDSEGQCNSECKTIERACQEVLGYSDTDVAEYLYKSKPNVDSLRNYLCKDLTKTCSTNPPPVPKDRTPGEPFVAKSDKEAEMEKILKSMEGKVLREKESRKGDWKQVVRKGIADTSATLKKHADRVSNQIRKWWRGKKTTTSKKGSKAGKSEL
ncbi:hypothetical protein TanjilG_11341 [Lupinus angustifolius]|uniref:Saposin B-type domain-containing protein n=1 Tax=Lupinus angustifolius TaxID=3871 RepID=A0A1J7I8L4_LUPAN|nr:hypothetical protein TanjilG_11341 [Lupinus angustifolius]